MVSRGDTMADTAGSKVSRTRLVMESYARSHAPEWLAEDVVFTISGLPQPVRGRSAVLETLEIFYHKAFDAGVEIHTVGADSEQALGVLEFIFRGRHIGSFMGIAPTGRSVEVAMAGIYHIEDNVIRTGHIYFDCADLVRQLTA
jgi:steroid delta-isomerase-like uncharacterized protein